MTIDEAIEVLELHNQWRKGAEIPMETPVRIGMAIDLVLSEVKKFRLGAVVGQSEQLICPHCNKYKRLQGNGIMHQLCECEE